MVNLNRHEEIKVARLIEQERKNDKAKNRSRKRIKAKLYFFLVLCSLIIGGLVFRIGYIMLLRSEEYSQMAFENQEKRAQARTVNPNRGAIVDRNKQNLAVSNIVYRVILDVRLMVSEDAKDWERNKGEADKPLTSEKTFAALSLYIDKNLDELREYVSKNPDGTLKYDTNWLNLGVVSFADAAEIKNNIDIKCVFLFEETERSFIYGGFAPQVLGFTRGDARWGIERFYNAHLSGVQGRVYSYGAADAPESVEAKNGNTVVTTLDFYIQQFAQETCDKTLVEYEAQNTSVIVMNPMTGEILAMAQSPSFDLNAPDKIEFVSSAALKNAWEQLEDKERMDAWNRIWTNFNVTSTFEPGSTFKPFVVAAALEEGIITPTVPVSYYCSGSRTYLDWEKPIPCHLITGHGQQTLEQVLANSCNVGMMEIGEKLGAALFYKYQTEFGFGEKTGIDLPSEESSASVVYSRTQLISPSRLATSSFGQGFNCTPIQVINAFAALINGGNLMQPYVVSQIVDANGSVVFENKPLAVRKVISKETSDYLRETMVSVVSSGTGDKAAIEGYSIGGKTGTAQQGDRTSGDLTLSFIAYLPAENPEILMMVLVNKPQIYIEGEMSISIPLRELMLKVIEYRGLLPTDSETAPISARAAEGSKKLGNYVGMYVSDAIASLNILGVPFDTIGSAGSVVTAQFPSEGSDVDADSRVILNIAPSEGEALIVVPDVVGMPLPQAVFILENCGFVPVITGAVLDPDAYADVYDAERGQSAGNAGPTGGTDDDVTDGTDGSDAAGGSNGTDGTGETGNAQTAQPKIISQMPSQGVQLPRGTQIVIRTEN